MKKVIAILLLVYINLFNAMEKTRPIEQQLLLPLNITIIIDDGLELLSFKKSKETQQAMVQELGREIYNANHPIITSGIVLRILNIAKQKEYKDIIKKLENNWTIYYKNNFDYFVLIPKKNTHPLTKLGFSALTMVENDDIPLINTNDYKKIEQLRRQSKISINLDSLFNLFNRNALNQKRIYLAGHGGINHVAGMKIHTFQEFLLELNKYHTEFLYYGSCLAGGLNSLKTFNQRINYSTEQLTLNYPVIIGSLTDCSVHRPLLNSNKLFARVNKYLKQKDKNSIPETSLTRFANIFKNIHKKGISHPQVLIPGTHRFQLIPLRQQAPTQETEQYELETFDLTESKLLPNKNINIYSKTIALYPSVIKPIMFIYDDAKIISMIPGRARHYIETLYLKKHKNYSTPEIQEVLTQIFDLEKFRTQAKVFFIKYLLWKDKDSSATIAKNVLIHIYPQNHKRGHEDQFLVIYQDADGDYRQSTSSLKKIRVQPSLIEKISKNDAIKKIKKIAAESKPTKEALKQAAQTKKAHFLFDEALKEALKE